MKSAITLIILAIALSSCGGKDSPETPIENETKELGDFNLIFPDNNLICTEGTDIGTNEVAIDFSWGASTNATSYTLKVINLDTDEITNKNSTTSSAQVTLPKDTQFSWTVTSLNGDKRKESTQWNFYSEGISQENFAPFPAEISVNDNENGTVKIDWPSSDLDDDITGYDVYFGIEPNPGLLLENVTFTTLEAQPISYNTEYYLMVVTKDSRNNTSSSNRQFKFFN